MQQFLHMQWCLTRICTVCWGFSVQTFKVNVVISPSVVDYNIKYWLTKKLILRGLHAVCKKINISTILGKGYFEHFANSKLKIKLHMCILLSVFGVPASSLWTRTSLFRNIVTLTFLCKATDWSVSLLFSHRNSSILVRPTRVCLSVIETKSMKVISVHYWH